MNKTSLLLALILIIPLTTALDGYETPRNGFSADSQISVLDTVIYNTGYMSADGTDWQAFSLSGTTRGNWVVGEATADIDLSEIRYVAIFSCSWNSGWNCGSTWQVRDRGAQQGEPTPEGNTEYLFSSAPEDITETSAVLTAKPYGLVNNDEFVGFFEYRQQGTQQWIQTPTQTRDDNHYFKQEITDLKNATIYEFRAKANKDETTHIAKPLFFRTSTPPIGGSIQGDFEALQALYTETNGDNWYDNTGWPDMTPETIGQAVGIITDANGRVIDINMQAVRIENSEQLGNNLQGTIENVPWKNLNHVRELRLKTNKLTGQIPQSIGEMTSLRWLALGGQRCDLSHSIKAWNENNHRGCGVSGKEWQETNSFSGPIPSTIGNLHNLEHLEIRRQHLTGTIPPEIGQLTNLIAVFLNDQKSENRLGGPLPAEMANLVNLKHLHLDSRSNTQGGFTYFPEEINTGLQEIRHIRLRDNQLTGTMPGFPNAYDLRNYVVGGNQFTGEFPMNIFQGRHSILNNFAVSGNNLTGEIPTNFIPPHGKTNYHSMSKFGIANNNFVGEIPQWIQDMRGHQVWDARGNEFVGGFPETVMDQPQLKTFTFSGNNLSGPLPNKEWATGRMITIYANNNNFNGSIPPKWESLTKSSNRMWILYLHNNDLEGEIPGWIANITNLERVYLHGNKFTPKDILPHREAIIANSPKPKYVHFTPQDPFGKAQTRNVGEMLDYSDQSYAGNTYQWVKDDNSLTGETNPTIDTTTHGPGEYVLEIVHPELDFTFTSEPITVIS